MGFLLRNVGKRKYEYFAVAMVVLMVISISAELLNFSYIIGALLAGLLLKDKLLEDKLYRIEHHIVQALEVFNFGVFHPIIFIWIGLSVNLGLLISNLSFGIVLTVIAIAGKLIGSMLGNYFSGEPLSEGFLVGWGLNARGATEVFALLIAIDEGIVTSEVFSAIVFMTLITTIISPIIFKLLLQNGIGVITHIHHKNNMHELRIKKKYLNLRE